METLKRISKFFEKNNTLKNYLLLASVFLIFSSIALFNLELLPFGNVGDFVFLVFIIFLFALYRPGWAFLFFVGFIILETVNLMPKENDITLRPYQILGSLGVLAIIIRFFSKRLNFDLPRFYWYDWALLLFSLSGFVSAVLSSDKIVALNQSLIIFSFFVLYVFTRIFVQNFKDIKRILPFFLGSSFIIINYSIWQNWRFIYSKNHFETMPGRSNGTFAEADWLGMFLVFLISVLYAIAHNLYKKVNLHEFKYQLGGFVKALFVWLMITLAYIALILTVSRSSWLGAMVVLLIFLSFIFKSKNYKMLGMVFASIVISLGAVYFFHLTNFELANRLESTGSRKQEITISCYGENNLPNHINNILELKKYNCRHINLEDIKKEELSGRVVTKVYRDDPNVSIRSDIYKKSWKEIKNNPIFGIGWGNISGVLGDDERGVGLNSSNIFLEIWLSAGIIGLVSFALVLVNVFWRGIIFIKKGIGKYDLEFTTWGLFLIISFFAIIVPNMFNAGIMLGFLWVWLAIAQAGE